MKRVKNYSELKINEWYYEDWDNGSLVKIKHFNKSSYGNHFDGFTADYIVLSNNTRRFNLITDYAGRPTIYKLSKAEKLAYLL